MVFSMQGCLHPQLGILKTPQLNNMLEAMAMSKPILMTDSGCLHINPKNGGFGELIQPQDDNQWSVSMNRILNNSVQSKFLVKEEGKSLSVISHSKFLIIIFSSHLIKLSILQTQMTTPFFSVVIPAYERPDDLNRCILSLSPDNQKGAKFKLGEIL